MELMILLAQIFCVQSESPNSCYDVFDSVVSFHNWAMGWMVEQGCCPQSSIEGRDFSLFHSIQASYRFTQLSI